MNRIALLSLAAAILLALAYVYGGRSAGRASLDGTTAYVTVIHGCLCTQPAFGMVEVAAVPTAGVELLDAEVTSGSQVFTMTLAPSQQITDCPPSGAMPGFGGGALINTPGGLLMGNPSADSMQLRLHFQAAGDEGWATVPITDVCSAES